MCLKEAALEIPGILNTGLLQLIDRGMKLPMSVKVTVHSGYGEAFPNTSTYSLGCNTVALTSWIQLDRVEECN